MGYKEEYKRWLANEQIDDTTKAELRGLTSEEEIEDRFYKDLEFGTAGMRGLMGAGRNRMNSYTVGRVTQAFADVLNMEGAGKSVVIAYDVRHNSEHFAQLAASIFAANGIRVYISDGILATPITSYAIRSLGADAGVIMTASHNPPDYNGYKAYGSNGAQILEDLAQAITDRAQELDYGDVRSAGFSESLERGRIAYIPEEIYDGYIADVLGKAINDDNIDKEIKIVYSPYNGTGYRPVKDVLEKRGFSNIYLVKEQSQPDPNFSGMAYPNPEEPKSFEKAIELGKDVGADMLIATDPDADRLGLMVRSEDGYRYMAGNEVGSLMVHYLLSQLTEKGLLPAKPVTINTIVTGDLANVISQAYGARVYETLTGFKNIAGVMEDLEARGGDFVFAFEESIGYLYGDSIRDKDGINAAMLVSEMVGFYKAQGQDLMEVLEGLYQEYGYYENQSFSVYMKGIDGQKRMERAMEDFRGEPIGEIAGLGLDRAVDYLKDETDLPKSDVLKYYYGESWIAIRPSGTEPKLKFYINAKADSKEEAKDLADQAEALIRSRL